MTPVATFVGEIDKFVDSYGERVDNWTDHTVDHQYTEYQKNTSAVVNNTRFSLSTIRDQLGDYSMRKPQRK